MFVFRRELLQGPRCAAVREHRAAQRGKTGCQYCLVIPLRCDASTARAGWLSNTDTGNFDIISAHFSLLGALIPARVTRSTKSACIGLLIGCSCTTWRHHRHARFPGLQTASGLLDRVATEQAGQDGPRGTPQLRHHFGNISRAFPSSPRPAHGVGYALLGSRPDWVLICACNPML